VNHPLSAYSNPNHKSIWGYAFLGACLYLIFKKDGLESYLLSNPSKTELKLIKQEGAEKIAENESWYVYKIKTHEACQLYGANTKWCITQEGGSYWRRYTRSSQFYFIISKAKRDDDWYKIAVQVERNGKIVYWDAKDQRHESLPTSLQVPEFDKKPKEGAVKQGKLTAEEIHEEYQNELESIIENEIQARVASYFDEDDYDSVTERQDIRLPWHMKEEYERRYIKEGNIEGKATEALRELMEMFPAVDEYVRNPDNAWLSWSNSSGMMPYGDANYPDDAVILYIGGIDSEEEAQLEVSDLMDMLNIEDENEEAFEDFLEEYGDYYGIRTHGHHGNTSVYVYGRHQTVHAIYFKNGDIENLVNEILNEHEFEKEFVDQAKELVEVVKENAGSFR
jgi:hypothetical protein